MMNDTKDLLKLEGVVAFVEGDIDWYDLPEAVRDTVYTHFLESGEMPYGVAKARTGDPDQWIAERLARFL